MDVASWIWGLQAVASCGSLAARRPWTALASGRRYPPQVRAHPLFAVSNRRITTAWTLYFAAAATVTAAAAHGCRSHSPRPPHYLGGSHSATATAMRRRDFRNSPSPRGFRCPTTAKKSYVP